MQHQRQGREEDVHPGDRRGGRNKNPGDKGGRMNEHPRDREGGGISIWEIGEGGGRTRTPETLLEGGRWGRVKSDSGKEEHRGGEGEERNGEARVEGRKREEGDTKAPLR
jgi:hypothetical protein